MLELETAESVREQASQKAQGHLPRDMDAGNQHLKCKRSRWARECTGSAAVLFGLEVVLL